MTKGGGGTGVVVADASAAEVSPVHVEAETSASSEE